MSTDNQPTQRIDTVNRDAYYHTHYHAAPAAPAPPRPPRRPWALVGGVAAALLAGGALVTTQLNARPVYYCDSHNTVKYHTDATCPALRQCGARVRSLPVGEARRRMNLCRRCH